MSDDSQRRMSSPGMGVGCGSFILIGLIVWFVAGGAVGRLNEQLERIDSRLDRIEQKLDEVLAAREKAAGK